ALGEVCRSALCVPGCITNDRCPVGTRCINNSCQEGIGCNSNNDCEQGTVCDLNNGECRDGECSQNSDCESGVCTNFTCIDPSSCSASQDCPIGQLCLSGSCVESDRCDPNVEVINISLARVGDEVGLSVDTSGREDQYQASCGGGAQSGDQVLEVQINTIGLLTVTVLEALDYDTVLFMRSRCEVEDSQITCNDDANDLLSEISTPILSPGVYYVFLDGFGSARGVAELLFTLDSLTECTQNSDCDGAPCLDGICGAPECIGDIDCAPNGICNAGICVDGERCRQDSQCPENQICENRSCVPGECFEDEDCGVRQICNGNRCERPECRQDADCPSGNICDEGRCIESCRVDADCDDIFAICEESSCVPAECLRDDQCAANESCNAGRCVSGGGGGSGQVGDPCANDNGCGSDLICEDAQCESAEGRCVEVTDCGGSGSCLGGNCVPAPSCQSADDCGGLIPLPIPLLCINNQCRAPFAQCSLNQECGDQQSCAFGVCIPFPANECLRDQDCGNGRLCENGSCQ
ncbi:MAG: hypothetical protein CMH49_08030, partial [Myxococcales bacterium]|nr:hypothetical protein [Myxococcales bacterium]